jgi:hypothetical protein
VTVTHPSIAVMEQGRQAPRISLAAYVYDSSLVAALPQTQHSCPTQGLGSRKRIAVRDSAKCGMEIRKRPQTWSKQPRHMVA